MAQFMAAEGGSRERGEEVILADDDREAWNRAAILLETIKPDELLDPTISPEEILFRLYHEDGVRVFDPSTRAISGARVTVRRSPRFSANTPAPISEDMIEDGAVEVTCDFCRTAYRFELDETGEQFKDV